MINMGKSLFRNADTDSIDTQLGYDTRGGMRKAFEGSVGALGGATMYIIRGIGKTVAVTFAIAVGGTAALVAGNKLLEEPQPVDIETFMQQYGIQGTPEEFIEKLLKDGTINPELIPHAEPDPEVEKGQKLLPGEIVEPRQTLEV